MARDPQLLSGFFYMFLLLHRWAWPTPRCILIRGGLSPSKVGLLYMH
jgi:hypothetical protein